MSPPGAGPGQRAVGAGAQGAGPGAEADRRGTGAPVRAGRAAGAGSGIMPAHLTPACSGCSTSSADPGQRLRRGLDRCWPGIRCGPPGRRPRRARGRTATCCGATSPAAPGRVRHTAEDEPRFEASAVADLRAAAARYPRDTACGPGGRPARRQPRSPSCGTAEVGTHERTARPCTTRSSGRSPWTATCSLSPAATCGWWRSPPRRQRGRGQAPGRAGHGGLRPGV